jgi:hypothetical protein
MAPAMTVTAGKCPTTRNTSQAAMKEVDKPRKQYETRRSPPFSFSLGMYEEAQQENSTKNAWVETVRPAITTVRAG